MEKIKDAFPFNVPIFTEDFLKLFSQYSRTYVFQMIQKAVESRELAQFSRGVYFLPRKTFYGFSTITADSVIERRFLEWDNDVFGIYSGLKLQNLFSVSTQVPNVIEVVTNKETMRCRKITIDGRDFILRQSRVPINPMNVNAYMVLQLFSDLRPDTVLNGFARQKIKDFIFDNKITKDQLFSLSMNFPARTIKEFIRTGLLNEIA